MVVDGVYWTKVLPKSFQGHFQMSQVFNGTKPSDHSADLCTLLFLDLLVPSALLRPPSSFRPSAWAGSLLLSSAPRWGPGTNRWARLCGPTPSPKRWTPLSWCLRGRQCAQIQLHVKNKLYFLEQSLINALVEFFSHLRRKTPRLLFALCRLFLPLLRRASLLLHLLLLLSPSLVPCRYRTRRFCLWGSEAPSRLPRLPLLSASAARQSEGAPDEADPPPVMWRIQVSQTLNLSTGNTVTSAEVKDVAKLRTCVKRMASTIHSLMACADSAGFAAAMWSEWMLIGHDGHVKLVVLTFKNIILTAL